MSDRVMVLSRNMICTGPTLGIEYMGSLYLPLLRRTDFLDE